MSTCAIGYGTRIWDTESPYAARDFGWILCDLNCVYVRPADPSSWVVEWQTAVSMGYRQRWPCGSAVTRTVTSTSPTTLSAEARLSDPCAGGYGRTQPPRVNGIHPQLQELGRPDEPVKP
jgi:hypothetical protein